MAGLHLEQSPVPVTPVKVRVRWDRKATSDVVAGDVDWPDTRLSLEHRPTGEVPGCLPGLGGFDSRMLRHFVLEHEWSSALPLKEVTAGSLPVQDAKFMDYVEGPIRDEYAIKQAEFQAMFPGSMNYVWKRIKGSRKGRTLAPSAAYEEFQKVWNEAHVGIRATNRQINKAVSMYQQGAVVNTEPLLLG